jgi:hypothetical protein
VNFLATENEEVVTAISAKGDTDILVCDTEKDEQTCVDMNTEKNALPEKSMLDNNTYNLMEQLIEENKSLWRIKNSYRNDASDDNEIGELWNFIQKDKQELVKLLTEKLRERL